MAFGAASPLFPHSQRQQGRQTPSNQIRLNSFPRRGFSLFSAGAPLGASMLKDTASLFQPDSRLRGRGQAGPIPSFKPPKQSVSTCGVSQLLSQKKAF